MRRSLVQFSGRVSLIHAPSLAVSITTTSEFRFSVHTGLPMPVRRSFLLDATTRSPHFSSYSLVTQAGAGRLFERSGERAIFLAVGAGERGDPVQAILRLIAVALLDLPQTIILPGLDVVRAGLQRALVPDLRDLVVTELAIGVANQIGDRGDVVVTERLQLPDGGGIVVAVIDRGVGCAITFGECRILDAGVQFAGLLLCLGLGRGGRRRVAIGVGVSLGDQRRRGQRPYDNCQRQNPDRESAHASLLFS